MINLVGKPGIVPLEKFHIQQKFLIRLKHDLLAISARIFDQKTKIAKKY